MCDERVRVSKYWWWKIGWLGWGGREGVMVVKDTAIHMEGVKVVMVGTADETREQLPIHCWNTHDEILLGQNSIKVLNSDNVQVHGEPKRRK